MIEEKFLALKFPAGSFATAIWEKVKQPPKEQLPQVDRLDLVGFFFGKTQEEADKRAQEWVDTRTVPTAFKVGPVTMTPADC